GPTAGTQYDQLAATGDVNLGDATLNADFGAFIPNPGTSFTLIRNDSANAVQGTFHNLQEGGTVTTINGAAIRISYAGGDGNDVILAVNGPFVYNSAGGDLTLVKHG